MDHGVVIGELRHAVGIVDIDRRCGEIEERIIVELCDRRIDGGTLAIGAIGHCNVEPTTAAET